MATCLTPAQGRRKLFWATQPDACGTETECGFQCGTPGLSLSPLSGTGSAGTTVTGSTVATTDWLRGLMINMLMSDGKKPDSECGYTAGAQGGHWSESYMTGSVNSVGTLLRTVETTSRVSETIALVTAHAKVTLERLVARGVANSVEVEAKYLSAGRFQLDIIVKGKAGETSRVGLSGQRLTNGWVWSS